jgi:hypothetical protein
MNNLVHLLKERVLHVPQGTDIVGRHFNACAPANPAAISAAESVFGYALPPTMRAIFLSVANGGFGPGYGVMGVDGGFTDDQGKTIVSRYQSFQLPDPEDPEWLWESQWLPFCHWGCGVYSIVNCIEPYPVFYADPGVKEIGAPMQSIFIPHKASFDSWLEGWLAGNDLWKEVWG